MKVVDRPMFSIMWPQAPAIFTQIVAPKPKPATASPVMRPFLSGNQRMPTAIGTT